MKLNNSKMTPKNSSADLLSSHSLKLSQSIPKLTTQSSVSSSTQKRNQYIANQRRQNLSAINNDCLIQRTSSSFSVPLLIDTMNTFFQATQSMEEEIMLPSRLKDMPVEQLVYDNTVHPDTWHEIYSFIRGMRNQLRCIHPFAEDDDQNTPKEPPRKASIDDEGIIIPNQDPVQFSSASSEVSSDEYEHSSTSSGATSYNTIKDELKYHYYGLFRSLDQLASMANRVTEKYREEYLS